jgi:hypothetical protein
MTTDSTVSRLLALIDHEIEIIVSVLSAASHTGGGSSPFTLMRKRDTAVDPNDDLLASYFRAVVAEYLDAPSLTATAIPSFVWPWGVCALTLLRRDATCTEPLSQL